MESVFSKILDIAIDNFRYNFAINGCVLDSLNSKILSCTEKKYLIYFHAKKGTLKYMGNSKAEIFKS